MKKRMLCCLLALVLAVGLLSACGSVKAAVYVQSVAALTGYGSLGGANASAGIVVAQKEIKVERDSSRKVKQLNVGVGQEVKTGEVLFTYDMEDMQLTIDKAKLEIEQMKNNVKDLTAQISQLEKEKKSAPTSEQLSYTVQIQALEADKKEAEYNITVKQKELDSMTSGSGKTTLMNLLGCLDVPTSGEYLLAGEDVTQANENHLAEIRNRLLGFVFQSFYLLPKLSAVDNVALPLLYAGVNKKERRERAIEALQMMGLGQRLNFRPNQLSGGQCQRVAIARAIVGRPKLLLADEPTGALDSAAGNQIMDIFDALNDAGSTIIMITHEQEIAERAKRINYIRDGILSDGRRDGESLA